MFNFAVDRLDHVVCLGAHPDDIELGCGGAVLSLIKAKPSLKVTWVVFSGVEPRASEATAAGRAFLRSSRQPQILVKGFTDGYFPSEMVKLKQQFEALKAQVQPDLIFTHTRHDLHQDHRAVCELTWNTWRNHLILEYEIVKYDGDLGHPNAFIPLSVGVARRKISLLRRHFKSQGSKHWFTEDVFLSILRLRGLECVSPSGLAEAFVARKMVLA